jgi:hypothetical protein
MKRQILLCIAAMLLLAGSSSAAYIFGFSGGYYQTLVINGTDTYTAVNQGWWSSTDTNWDGNDNYIAGQADGRFWNNYFVFDLTDFEGEVASATLVLNTYTIVDPPFTYSLWDVSTDPEDLAAKVNNPNAGIYADLGSGVQYGSYFVTGATPQNDFISISLNAAALAAIDEAVGGAFAIGGTVEPSAVPEPSSFAMLGLGCAGLFAALRRRRA